MTAIRPPVPPPPAEGATAVPTGHGPALMAPPLRRRMACWLYEGMLMFGVVFIAGYLFSTLTQTRHALDNRHALQAFLFVVFGIYFAWFWSRGHTLAMKTWHIRVVDRAGRALSQPRALARYLFAWLWFLPPLALATAFTLSAAEVLVLLAGWVAIWALLSRFHPERQFLHDALAGTRLIHQEALPRQLKRKRHG
ncbi:RDD family protein [Melaminivora suipulveris]|uniref:RDD family protein n=1 Tax=Melaminivora suipulveris TaxID=2109913 RepID=A0A2R3Q8D6_9BURK|nr:RDD family protein [Melaminivora suipulveris]